MVNSMIRPRTKLYRVSVQRNECEELVEELTLIVGSFSNWGTILLCSDGRSLRAEKRSKMVFLVKILSIDF